MSANPSPSETWRRYTESYAAFSLASTALTAPGLDRVEMVRDALRTGRDVMAACRVIGAMNPEELKQLFDVLVEWASTGHGLVHVFRDAILSLPREWVFARIEDAAEPFLQEGTYDEYRRFLELYVDLDRGLTLKLARRAAAHEDEDIREAGEDYLESLGAAGPEGVPAGGTTRDANDARGVNGTS
jgi:hypothetical protein